MSNNKKIIIISFVSLVFVLGLVIGITKSFMKPIEEGGNVTDVSLNSCAKIKLTSTSNVNLSNSYPMSRNKGLKTTPYKFTVTSYCDSYVGFNLYVATLSSNTLDASNIRYILTNSGSKDVVAEGLLADASDGVVDFSDVEKTELNTGLKGTYGNIYKIHSESIPLKGNKSYDLYLFVDGDASNTNTMGKTFKAGVAVKSYDRENFTLADYIVNDYNINTLESSILLHNSTLTGGANDNSYRYVGANPNNYVCFGSEEAICPENNLYRIIGVFDGKIKLIKNVSLGIYYHMDSEYWINTSLYSYLNGDFLTSLGDYGDLISTTSWQVGGNSDTNILTVVPSAVYQNEIVNPNSSVTVDAKIGLMYVSDYLFAASSDKWNLVGKDSDEAKDYRAAINFNWLYTSVTEWTLTPLRGRDTIAYLGFYVPQNFFFAVLNTGGVVYNSGLKYQSSFRPVFSLISSVDLLTGNGSKGSPYRISKSN